MPDSWIERVRLKFERDFTMTPNEWARDPKLSRGARGLLTELLSHDAGYRVSVRSLVATGPEGRTAIDTLVRELKQHEYLEHEIVRGAHGRIDGVIWRMTDPAEVRARRARQPHLDFPDDGSTARRKTRHAVNPHLKEEHPEEDLYPGTSTGSSTRAGDNEDALSGDSLRDAANAACSAWTRTGHHVFNDADPGARCEYCGRVRRDGRVYDSNDRLLLPALEVNA